MDIDNVTKLMTPSTPFFIKGFLWYNFQIDNISEI